MDAADLALVRALLDAPLAPVAALARSAGLGDGAARARARRLQEEGVLGGVSAVPNGALLGRRYVTCLYGDLDDWRAPLRVPSVIGCSVNHDGVAAPVCLSSGGVPDDLRSALGEPDRVFVEQDAPLEPPGAVLSDLQWRVLTAVVDEPGAGDRDLADAAGVSVRTARRHRDAFLRGGHLRLEVHLRSLRGDHVLFHLYVQGPGSHEPAVVDALAARLGGAWTVQRLDRPRGALVFCCAGDLAEAVAAPRLATRLPGVEHAELVIHRDGAYVRERLVAACERARAATARAR